MIYNLNIKENLPSSNDVIKPPSNSEKKINGFQLGLNGTGATVFVLVVAHSDSPEVIQLPNGAIPVNSGACQTHF